MHMWNFCCYIERMSFFLISGYFGHDIVSILCVSRFLQLVKWIFRRIIRALLFDSDTKNFIFCVVIWSKCDTVCTCTDQYWSEKHVSSVSKAHIFNIFELRTIHVYIRYVHMNLTGFFSEVMCFWWKRWIGSHFFFWSWLIMIWNLNLSSQFACWRKMMRYMLYYVYIYIYIYIYITW